MGDYDESTPLYYTHQELQLDTSTGAQADGTPNEEALNDAALRAAQKKGGDTDEDAPVNLDAVRRHFREFLRESYKKKHVVLLLFCRLCFCCWTRHFFCFCCFPSRSNEGNPLIPFFLLSSKP